MQTLWVILAYLGSTLLALVLLYFFHARWYWHVLSIAAAVGVGIAPPLPSWWPPDIVVGSVFIFLLVWGVGAPLFWKRHREARRSGAIISDRFGRSSE